MNRLGIWLAWVLASAAGVAAGLTVLWGVARNLDEGSAPAIALLESGLAFGLVGALTGALQWLVLRGLACERGWWVPASIVGVTAGALVLAAVFAASVGLMGEESVAGLVVASLAGGTATGVVQWLVLRGLFRQAGWWIPASAAGLAACTVVFLSVTRGADVNLIGIALGGALGGAVYGAITGPALVLLQGRRELAT